MSVPELIAVIALVPVATVTILAARDAWGRQ